MGAGAPAKTGEARAMHRGVCFAGMPAPTGVAVHAKAAFECYFLLPGG
ncbi:diguanylate cyclase [Pseudomonas sp. FW306-2-2C-D06B]|nr:diguanylate cyclase [Pseudomonas sp. FW306-2-2C-D06B]PNA91517.1 diguanylate cyclase [Pseudomonas sp. GW460-5]PNB58427.1 diguanylate cyclase [Pseudomonas sp. FW305-130]RJT87128.1 diguanylate cyclase [Arthrobacter frigidicola]